MLAAFPTENMKVFISSTPESILGIDILQGQILQTSISEFSLQVSYGTIPERKY